MSSARARARTRGAAPRTARAAGAGRTSARTRRAQRRRRWYGLFVLLALAAVAVGVAASHPFSDAVKEITLPLRHEDIIRQQARDKNLDPALIAAMIYEESRFRDQTSPAGAKGLMQIVPDTARFIARRSGGTQFQLDDLATPQVNIAYGSWYIRYLLQHYGGEEEPAVAAYNAGLTNVDRWVAAAGGAEDFDADTDARFRETRNYVNGVLERRGEYAERYPRELGLDE